MATEEFALELKTTDKQLHHQASYSYNSIGKSVSNISSLKGLKYFSLLPFTLIFRYCPYASPD